MKYGYVLRRGLLGLSLLLLLSAPTSLPQKEVWIARGASPQEIARFTVEVADTPETWEHGLMERAALAPNAGMLFIFPDVTPRAFWMMHTIIPLDMLFIDADRRIINIQDNAPPCAPPRRCPTYHSTAPAKYVLEIPGGRARTLDIRAGDQVHF
jgi:uncharacterized membrane protein (UPF0127 family)